MRRLVAGLVLLLAIGFSAAHAVLPDEVMADPAKEMVNGVTQMFLAALQIAGPLIVVLFLADVGLGLLTRVAPALNAFSLGFPLKIMLTVVLSAIVFVALPGVVSGLTDTAVKTMLGVGR